jgi:hypothetical protein
MAAAVTLDQLDIALAQLAEIIERSPAGEKYWPIFDRLEDERKRIGGRADRLSMAKRRVSQAPLDQRAA